MAEGETSPALNVLFHHVHIYVHQTKTLKQYKELEEDLNRLAQMGHYDPFSGGMRFLEPKAHSARVAEGREMWRSIRQKSGRPEDIGPNQDFIEQLIVGLGWRVTATYIGPRTSSFLVTSSDPRGVKICVTSKRPDCDEATALPEPYHHFDASNIERFMEAHNQRQGVAVLGFEVGKGEVARILQRYRTHHPNLLVRDDMLTYTDTRTIARDTGSGSPLLPPPPAVVELGAMRILEAFAYYAPAAPGAAAAAADRGTVLRFVERAGTFAAAPGFANPEGVLPGLADADPRFDGSSIPAYADHWVSNVVDREGFMATARDALGLTPKVDFNAGVIAAGQARIESTVIGSSAPAPAPAPASAHSAETATAATTAAAASAAAAAAASAAAARLLHSEAAPSAGAGSGAVVGGGGGGGGNSGGDDGGDGALRDQSQIFLPVNNALSASGHVHGFLRELGQGVQHIASRVGDLVSFVERVANYRRVTGGGGLAFLRIPRSYYGALSARFMVDQGVPQDLAEAVMDALVADGSVDGVTGVVDLSITGARVARLALPTAELRAALEAHLPAVKLAVKRGRYSNLYQLLGDRLTEEEYLHTVENQILVDIQGEDVLFQIFTAKILQEHPSHEAPFFEFIQRLCKKGGGGADPPPRAGCGGFGIRNFLTLFLSIELSAALDARARALAAGDAAAAAAAQRRADLFARQLEESNPILTAISDAMRAEGEALERLAAAEAAGPAEPGGGGEGEGAGGAERRRWAEAAAAARREKEARTAELQGLSQRYDELMRAISSS